MDRSKLVPYQHLIITSDTYIIYIVYLLIMQRLDLRKKLFLSRALLALGISVIADVIDFIGGPILAIPPIGDIPNALVTGLLFAITRNKRSAAISTTIII